MMLHDQQEQQSYQEAILWSLSVNQKENVLSRRIPVPPLPREPYLILDAPGLRNDFYLNILDWNAPSGGDGGGQLAVALNQTVYLYDMNNARTVPIVQTTLVEGNCYISALAFLGDDELAVATSEGCLEICNISRTTTTARRLNLSQHGRIAVIAAAKKKDNFALGFRNGTIMLGNTALGPAHQMEVCGLEWDPSGRFIASGSNDNSVCVWDLRRPSQPLWRFEHEAAVKAVAWCPWRRNLLATGAGAADRHIRIWNTATGTCLGKVDTGAQVCAVKWLSPETIMEDGSLCAMNSDTSTFPSRYLLSTSGYNRNDISWWHYPSLRRLASLPAHGSRILQTCMSPDGQSLVTAAANESLKFWRINSNISNSIKSRFP